VGPIRLPGEGNEWLTFHMCLRAIPNLPLSTTEQRKLYVRIMSVRNSRGPQRHNMGQDCDIMGRNLRSRVREHNSFPGGNFRADWRALTPIRTAVGTPGHPEGLFDDPPIPGEILGRFICVPDLPYTDTFCYFAKKPWVADLLKDLYRRFPDRQEEICPLMKARVLELIDIF
jgi:hypothetical protein